MDIEGLGEKLVDQLVDLESCERPRILSARRGHARRLERMGDEIAPTTSSRHREIKDPDFCRFVYGGNSGVGEEVAKILAKHFVGLDALLDADWAGIAEKKKEIQKENAARKRRGEAPLPPVLEGIGPELMRA